MAKRRDGRTQAGTFQKGKSGNPSGVRRVPELKDIRADDWRNPATGQGVFGKDKRLPSHFVPINLTFDQLKDLWLGDDLAARSVETIPKEAMRQGYDIMIASSDDESNSDVSEIGSALLQKLEILGLDEYLEILGSYERGYGGGAALLGANDGQTDLSKPLNLKKVRSLDWITPLEAREIMPLYAYGDPRAPKYGEPEIYQLSSRSILPSYAPTVVNTSMLVHETRLLVFPGIRVSRYQTTAMRGGWGESVLTRVYRVLRDFNAAWSAAGVLVTDFAQAVIKIAGLWEALSLDGGKAFENRLGAMEYGRATTNAITIDAGDSYERQQTPLSGLPDLLEKFAIRLAAACDMPLTLLFGTSPGGMNATGESDIRFFYDRVAAYQQRKIAPHIRRVCQILFQVMGEKEPEKWGVKFRPLWQESAKDKAAAMLTQAQADSAWITASVLSAEEVAQAHWGKGEYDPNITVDFDAREAQEQATASPFTEADMKAADPTYKPPPPPPPGMNPDGTPTEPPPKGTPDPTTPPQGRSMAEDRADGDWDESAHPRGEGGKFGEASVTKHETSETGQSIHVSHGLGDEKGREVGGRASVSESREHPGVWNARTGATRAGEAHGVGSTTSHGSKEEALAAAAQRIKEQGDRYRKMYAGNAITTRAPGEAEATKIAAQRASKNALGLSSPRGPEDTHGREFGAAAHNRAADLNEKAGNHERAAQHREIAKAFASGDRDAIRAGVKAAVAKPKAGGEKPKAAGEKPAVSPEKAAANAKAEANKASTVAHEADRKEKPSAELHEKAAALHAALGNSSAAASHEAHAASARANASGKPEDHAAAAAKHEAAGAAHAERRAAEGKAGKGELEKQHASYVKEHGAKAEGKEPKEKPEPKEKGHGKEHGEKSELLGKALEFAKGAGEVVAGEEASKVASQLTPLGGKGGE